MKPKYIIESGVLLGWGSYLMRKAAGPDTHFIYISPISPDINARNSGSSSYFIDDGPSTQLWNEKFLDFNKIDWDSIGISETDRKAALVYFDDH